jgi:hypothetical protein
MFDTTGALFRNNSIGLATCGDVQHVRVDASVIASALSLTRLDSDDDAATLILDLQSNNDWLL